MRSNIKISFSWDDGSIYDLKLAKLMKKYNIKAMFFVPTTNWEQPYIKKEEILEILNLGMEIGGHTHSHRYLTTIKREKIEKELVENKKYLEDIIKKTIDIFCYPGGYFDDFIHKKVKENFKLSRSAKTLRFNVQKNPLIDTTFHFYPRGAKSIIKNCIQNDIKMLPLVLKSYSRNTFKYYKNILLNLNDKQEYNIHIWGHGWEIEKNELWEELENFLKFLKENKFDIKSMTEIYL